MFGQLSAIRVRNYDSKMEQDMAQDFHLCVLKVCVLYLPAERCKRIQSLLVLGGVAHHGVVTTSSLQRRENRHL